MSFLPFGREIEAGRIEVGIGFSLGAGKGGHGGNGYPSLSTEAVRPSHETPGYCWRTLLGRLARPHCT